MPFDTKKTLESWKKAKPLLLRDTGVSEVLRSLPADPEPAQLAEFVKVMKKLDLFMADPKIKAEKKAVACLAQIKTDIDKYLVDQKDVRESMIKEMSKLMSVIKKILARVVKGPVTRQSLVGSYMELSEVIRGLRIDPQGHCVDKAAVPHTALKPWTEGLGLVMKNFEDMIKVAERAQQSPSASDLQKALLPMVKESNGYLKVMDKGFQAAKALK